MSNAHEKSHLAKFGVYKPHTGRGPRKAIPCVQVTINHKFYYRFGFKALHVGVLNYLGRVLLTGDKRGRQVYLTLAQLHKLDPEYYTVVDSRTSSRTPNWSVVTFPPPSASS